MNKILLLVLGVLFPFYPLIAYAFHFVNSKPMMFFLNLLMLPVALYYLVNSRRKLPPYLVAFLLFTLYHVGISFFTNTLPETRMPFFLFFLIKKA